MAEIGGSAANEPSPSQGWQAALNSAVESLERIAEHLDDSLWLLERETLRPLYVSEAYCRIWGRDRAEAIEKPESFYATVHPDDVEPLKQALGDPERRFCEIEHRIVRPDGELRWIRSRRFPVCDASGAVLWHAGVARDITAAKQRDAALAETEERFRVMGESAFDQIVEFDPEGRVTGLSPNVEGALGVPPAKIVGRRLQDYVHPEDAEQVARLFYSVAEQGREVRTAFRLSHGKQGWRWREATATPFRTASGEVRVLTVSRDITAQKTAEERLRASEEHYRALVEEAPEGILVHRDGTILYANAATREIAGAVESGSMVGRRVEDFVDPSQRDLLAQRFLQIRQGDAVEPREFLIHRDDGTTRTVLSSGVSIEIHGGRSELAMMRDMTPLREAQRERERLREKLQRARHYESLGVLAGGIAHDFNNLLTVILGNVSLALDDLRRTDPATEHLREAVEAGERARLLTRQLLSYAGKRSPETRAVDLGGQVRGIADLLRALLHDGGELQLELAADPAPVAADVAQLQQVVMNLVLNAGQAMDGRPGAITIRTGVTRLARTDLDRLVGAEQISPGTYAVLEVADCGTGIEPAARPRIFDPFFTTRESGQGLGLSAVLGMVRSHAGGIEVESEPGEGALFRIYLPVAALAPRTESLRPGRAELSGAGTILVADSSGGIRSMLRRVLTGAGYSMIEAIGPRHGVQLFRELGGAVEAVVLDVVSPAEFEGLLGEMRSIRPDARVLLTTGEAGVVREACKGTEVLAKPYLPTDLLARLQELIGD